MFQFPGFPRTELFIHSAVTGLQPAGFPHSDIKGSMPACGSPLLFAACHVLLRRLVPWHPPCALLRLITLLRLLAFSSGQLTFQFATGLSRLFSSSSLCSCQGAREISLPLRLPFGILKTIQIRERQLFLGHSFVPFLRLFPDCLFYRFALSGSSAIDLGLKPPLSLRFAP